MEAFTAFAKDEMVVIVTNEWDDDGNLLTTFNHITVERAKCIIASMQNAIDEINTPSPTLETPQISGGNQGKGEGER